jgi:hypothetical protein
MLSRTGLVLLVLAIGLVLSSCGSDEGDGVRLFSGTSDSALVEPDADPADYDVYEAEVAEEAVDHEPGDAAQFQPEGFDRRVIRSGELELYVSDVRAAVRHARDTAEEYGGYVESSSTYALDADSERAELTLEVPSDSFDTVLDSLRNGPHVARIDHEVTSSRDVTEEYVDLRSQLSNLESTESRFVDLLDDAHTISEVLNVESEISRIRGEIERIQGRINYLEQRTDYSRIYVAFHPEEDETVTVAGAHFTPGETAREAWNASMQFVGAVGNALIAVTVFFWWGWPLLGAAVLWLLHYRRRRQQVAESTA